MDAGGGAGGSAALDEGSCPMSAPEPATREVLLVRPATVDAATLPLPPVARDSYSYTSMAAELHEEGEDRFSAAPVEAVGEDEFSLGEPGAQFPDGKPDDAVGEAASRRPHGSEPASSDDPTALGSAFHAAAQWLIETGADSVPVERIEALVRYWGVSPAQRERLTTALARWEGSRVRAELLSWPQVRAEVPFFSLGMDEARERFGAYAEGAIDALATDPARPGEALVIDYKTGGSANETAEQLQKKHELQARVYADVLHRAGFSRVALAFVRVEIEDPAHVGEPQVVRYEQ